MERETRVQCRRPRRPRPSVSQMAAERMEITGRRRRPPPTQSRRPLVRPLVLKDYDEKYARELPR